MNENLDLSGYLEKFYTEKKKQDIKDTYGFAKSFFDSAKEKDVMMGAHGLDHGLRVVGNAVLISQGEGTDFYLPVITSFLIDIGRSVNDERAKDWRHGQISAELAEPFLRNSLKLEEDKVIMVLNALRDHGRLNNQVENLSELVKVVMDADRLATIGPLAPMRAAATRHQLPLVLPESDNKSFEENEIDSVLQDVESRVGRWFESIWTDTAKKIGMEKQRFLLAYVQAVKDDVRPVYDACREIGL